MRVRRGIVVACLLAIAGNAAGQVQQGQRVYDVDNVDYHANLSTAPSLGVGLSAAVVAGSHGIVLYDKLGGQEDTRIWTGSLPFTGYPFAPASPSSDPFRHLVHPQADYDPISGRLWMLYTENFSVGQPETDWPTDDGEAFVHMAVNKDPAIVTIGGTIDNLSDGQWWYYTGRTAEMTDGNGGVAFDFAGGVDPFRSSPPGEHNPTAESARYPSLGFDERAVIVAFSGNDNVFSPQGNLGLEQFVYILPREHSGGTFVDGDRPPEGEIISINMTGEPVKLDKSVQARVVQEPFEQYDNTTLLVSTLSEDPGTLQEDIRIKGLFFNTTSSEWEVRQRLEEFPVGSSDYRLIDMDVASLGLGYFRPDDGVSPDYPDAFGFSPTVEHDMFTSAVLTEDASGNPRVFAVHAVLPDDGGNPSDHWVVQWYVIDADLGDFITPAIESEDWRPSIVEAGRIEVEDAHCYHPVLGVSKDGLMTIEYTYSATGEEQEIRRQRFDSSYAPLGLTTTLRTGPEAGFGSFRDRWALWGDLQFDPVIGQSICDRLWSTHTLVEEGATSNTDIRDVWLFRQNQSATGFCFQTDMNQDGITDTYDMMLYTDYYTAGDERADTNADGQIDSTDMANYLSAYDAATGP